MTTTFTAEDHFIHFAEFVKAVELASGTTPHVAMTVESMNRLDDPLEKLWFAGCYALTYNWPAAERLFLERRPDNPPDVDWLTEHWAGLPLRKERKSVFRKDYFARSAATYANLAMELVDDPPWPLSYESAFSMFTQGTYCMGRYIAIRWLEVMRRAFPASCSDWVMPSILSDGGQHPRKALALIYPAYGKWLLGGNDARELRVSDTAAAQLKVDMELEYGIQTNFYEMQSLLCEYKQSVLGRKQYPGKSIDTEVDYFDKVQAHWSPALGSSAWDAIRPSQFLDVRKHCFAYKFLGEFSGWHGVRPELSSVLAEFGYTWSDVTYDYAATRASGDFSSPVQRGPALL